MTTTIEDAPAPEAHTPDAAAELLASNRRRRKLRRWLLIGTIPLVLVTALFVGKVLSMYAFAHQAITSYLVSDFSGSLTAAQGQSFLNVLEPYKAPYNLGDAHAGGEQLEQARARFEEALPLAPGLEACAVRINLAIVMERQGDEASRANDPVSANGFYKEGLAVTAETPEECNSEEAQQQSPDPDRPMDETLENLKDRLQEKQRQEDQKTSQQPEQGEGEEQDQPQQPSEDDLEELKQNLEQNQQEREESGVNGGGDEPGGGGGTDKPW